MAHNPIMALSLIGFVSLACQWLAWRVKLPAILFLLIAGIVVGPIIGYLHPRPTVLARCLCQLFPCRLQSYYLKGSLTLNIEEVIGLGRVIRKFNIVLGLLLTFLLITVLSHFIFHFDLYLSPIFGAIVSITRPNRRDSIVKRCAFKEKC